jgi:hypothetical protein
MQTNKLRESAQGKRPMAVNLLSPFLKSVRSRVIPVSNPAAVPPWTISTQTFIHDFDAINCSPLPPEPTPAHGGPL